MRSCAMNESSIFSNNDAGPVSGTRRDFLVRAGVLAGVTTFPGTPPRASAGQQETARRPRAEISGPLWPDGIPLGISISMQLEAGGPPANATDSPFPRVDVPPGPAS